MAILQSPSELVMLAISIAIPAAIGAGLIYLALCASDSTINSLRRPALIHAPVMMHRIAYLVAGIVILIVLIGSVVFLISAQILILSY
jgi:hypothetical protein